MGPRFQFIDPAWRDYEKAHPIVVAASLDNPHDMTIAAAAALNAELPLPREKLGARRTFQPCRLLIRVHPSSVERALRISDALVKACDMRGFAFRPGRETPDAGALIVVDGEPIPLALHERMARRPYTPTRKELARKERGEHVYWPAYDYRPSGELSLRTSRATAWKDHPRRRLEAQLNDVMLGLRAIAARTQHERCRRQELDERIEAFHARRAGLRQQVEEEQEAVDRLEADAGDWRRAQAIRAYIAAVEAQPAETGQRADHRAWAAWAHQQADRLDPLRISPASILDTPTEEYRDLSPFDELPDHLFE